MKKQILTSLILASVSVSAFALPHGAAPSLQGAGKTISVAADGAERTGANRLAEGGAERLQERVRLAEDGAERTGVNRIG